MIVPRDTTEFKREPPLVELTDRLIQRAANNHDRIDASLNRPLDPTLQVFLKREAQKLMHVHAELVNRHCQAERIGSSIPALNKMAKQQLETLPTSPPVQGSDLNRLLHEGRNCVCQCQKLIVALMHFDTESSCSQHA